MCNFPNSLQIYRTHHRELGSVVRDWMALRASTALLTALMASSAELKELLLVVAAGLGPAAVDRDTGSVKTTEIKSHRCYKHTGTVILSWWIGTPAL